MNPMSSNLLIKCGLLIFLWNGLVYLQVFDNDFVNWDDPMFITDNSRIRSLDLEHLLRLFTTSEAGAYTPLSQLSLALDFQCWGLNPVGYHFTNLLLHLANAWLVFLIARKVLMKMTPGSRSASYPVGALIASLWFSIHPMRVESVAWASERRDVLSGFWGLMSVVVYLDYLEALTYRISERKKYYLSFGLFFAAVLSKAVVITLPVIFLLLDGVLYQRFQDPLKGRLSLKGAITCLAEKIPFLLISLGVGLGMMTVLLSDRYALSVRDVGLEPRIAQSLAANMSYLSKLILPIELNPLDRLYDSYQLGQPVVLFALLINGGITLLCFVWRPLRTGGLLAWFSYLLIIGPFLGLAQSGLQLTADRYTYLAAIPLGIFVGGVAEIALRTHFRVMVSSGLRRLLALSLCIYLFGLSVLSFLQVQIWKSSETLWKYSLRLDPQNGVAWCNLGDFLMQANRITEAIQCFDRAKTLAPYYTDAWFNLGNAYRKNQQLESAIEAYRRILTYEPTHSAAHHNLAVVYAQQTNWALAVSHYQISQKIEPSPSTLYNLAWCFEHQEKWELALRLYQQSAHEGFPEAWIKWSELLGHSGDREGALNILRMGLDKFPNAGIQLAYIEWILSDPQSKTQDRERAKEMLLQMNLHTQGKSQKVQDLLKKFSIQSSESGG
jgi:tetratricopeptide (TPR) repeat protein